MSSSSYVDHSYERHKKQIAGLIEAYKDSIVVTYLRDKGWSKDNAEKYYAVLLLSVGSKAVDSDRVFSYLVRKARMPVILDPVNSDSTSQFGETLRDFKAERYKYTHQKEFMDQYKRDMETNPQFYNTNSARLSTTAKSSTTARSTRGGNKTKRRGNKKNKSRRIR
jgi:hypothetical protein